MKLPRQLTVLLIGIIGCGVASAGGGPLGIDHRLNRDDTGVWSRQNQMLLINGLLVADVSGALWLGSDTRIGKTYWYSLDSTLISAVAAQALKSVFSRERPTTTDNPNEWFKGSGNESFPSGEVTTVTSIVMPFVLEYRSDHPMVYALELLPLYDGIARMKSQAHWQTDVLAGFALGTGISMLMQSRDMPLLVSWLPNGFSVGINKRF